MAFAQDLRALALESQPTSTPHIQRLPDELLDMIIQEAYNSIRDEFDSDEVGTSMDFPSLLMKMWDFAPLTRVCQRFNRLAIPRLYSTLAFKTGGVFASGTDVSLRSGLRLYRTLRENPDLRVHCRRLMIWGSEGYECYHRSYLTKVIGDPVETGFGYASYRPEAHVRAQRSMACEIVSWSPNARNLKLALGDTPEYGRDPERLIELAGSCMPFLTSLSIIGKSSSTAHLGALLDVRHVVIAIEDAFTISRLTSLTLGNMKTSHNVTGQVKSRLESPVEWPMGLQNLRLCGFWSHEAVACLASRTKLLQTLRLDMHTRWNTILQPPQQDSLATFRRNRETLETLVLSGRVPTKMAGNSLFELCHSTKLSSLTLTTGIEGNSGVEMHNMHKLVAILSFRLPNLSSISWKIENELVCGGALSFGKPQEDWLRTFVGKAAINTPKLRSIEVDYKPSIPPVVSFSTLDGADTMYPWDRLEGMKVDFKHEGIRLTWGLATISGEDYQSLTNPACQAVEDASRRVFWQLFRV